MDPLSDFMASSHLSESGPTIAFSITRRFTVAQQHDLQDRVTVLLCSSTRPCRPTRFVVTWFEAQWSPSSASTSIGVGATGTTSCTLLHTGWSDGSITSSSPTTLPLNSFERNLSSRKNPFIETLFFRIWDRRCTQLFWIPYEEAFIRFGFELISWNFFT